MKSRQGKKAQRIRARWVERRLRATIRDQQLEVDTAAVLDDAIATLARSWKYPDLAFDIDAEMERITKARGIREVEEKRS